MKKQTISIMLGAILLTGCQTGVGRAFSSAFTGTPKEVAESIHFVNDKMGRELRNKYAAIESARVTNIDGSVNAIAAENRFRDMALTHAEIEEWESLSEALADWAGIDLEENPSASERQADKRRRELWSALSKGAKDALEELRDD